MFLRCSVAGSDGVGSASSSVCVYCVFPPVGSLGGGRQTTDVTSTNHISAMWSLLHSRSSPLGASYT